MSTFCDVTRFVQRLVRQEVGNAFQVQFVKTEVTPEVSPTDRLISVLDGELSRQEIMARLRLRDEGHVRETYLNRALEAGLIERTIPATPRSSKQRRSST